MSVTKQQHQQAHTLVKQMANKPATNEIIQAAKYRDKVWERAGINLTKSIDLYTTTKEAAQICVQAVFDVMKETGRDPTKYTYVEPSAGNGVFVDLLKNDYDVIAMDILPQRPDIQRQEFLTWLPEKKEKYVIVGAPPLGVYSDVSVEFINHALEFADVVGFIVRRHIGERQIPGGNRLKVVGLERGAVVDMTCGAIQYDMEFRVWETGVVEKLQ